MRWPWAPQPDRIVPLVQEFARQHREQEASWQDRYERLLDKYHALKLAGASTPDPKPSLDRPEIDPVMAAITEKAGPDRRLRAMMGREAAKARNLGTSDIEIIQQIEQGVPMDEGIPV